MKMLLYMTLGGSALALLLLALRYVFLRRMPSTVYYYAWLLVLLRFALPLPGLMPTQAQKAESLPAAPTYSAAPFEEAAEPYVFTMPEKTAAPKTAAPTGTETDQTGTVPAVVSSAAPRASRSFDWRSGALWLSIWAVGAVFSLAITVCAYLTFTRRLRQTLRRADPFSRALYASFPGKKPSLWRCRAVKTPLMYGIFSPKIVLPDREYDEDQLANILRHELMHYRRRDPLYKWLAVFVLSAHWFNPLSWVIRREIGRACELSCDEMLLRGMTRFEKQSYGNTLLNTAASGALPAGVVATTFATEKKNLKERLEQIMTYKKSTARLIAAMLTLVLLAGCGVVAGPALEKEEASHVPDPTDALRVSSIDELLDAIAPNTLILLEEGEYDLSSASTYGEADPSPYYSWNPKDKGGYELSIHNVDNLNLFGAGMDKTTITAEPRYANVMKFVDCHGLTLSDLTAGHTEESGFCQGGVLCLETCSDVSVLYCGLYGCGTIAVYGEDCNNLSVADSHIYECSIHALYVVGCRNVRVTDNEVYRLGVQEGQELASVLFDVVFSDGVSICGNRVYDNSAQYLLHSKYAEDISFLSNEVYDNRFDTAVFDLDPYSCIVDGCSFHDNVSSNPNLPLTWSMRNELGIYDRNGDSLDEAALEAMTLEEIDPNSVFPPVQAEQAAAVPSGEEIAVSTVDEFLKAIGPERTIVLKAELFDLSEAANYGSKGGEYYYWREDFDGPALVIKGVKDLAIRAEADSPRETTVSAVPRYADVLSFVDCENITLSGFTAGHTKEPGSCSGGVLLFENCGGVLIERCRLFGCGILGLQTRNCRDLRIESTKIYECSQGAGSFSNTDGIAFSGCVVTDVPSPALYFSGCSNISWNGEALVGMQFDIDENQSPVDPASGLSPEEALEARKEEVELATPASIAELENPHFNDPAHSYDPNSPIMLFAAEIQRLIADGDWEALSKKMYYPLAVYSDDRSFHLWTETEFVSSMQDEGFYTKNGIEEFRQRVAAASLDEFGECIYGDTFCEHLIALFPVGDPTDPGNLRVSCLSLQTPLWPGNPAQAEAVLPTPGP